MDDDNTFAIEIPNDVPQREAVSLRVALEKITSLEVSSEEVKSLELVPTYLIQLEFIKGMGGGQATLERAANIIYDFLHAAEVDRTKPTDRGKNKVVFIRAGVRTNMYDLGVEDIATLLA